MRLFVTGATGFIGSAVVAELLSAGHEVTGLARSEDGARKVAAAGARPLLGDLSDLTVLRGAAENSDGVLHLGFNHDFSRIKENSEMDRLAIQAFGEVFRGSSRRLIVTAGVAGLRHDGRVATERDEAPDNPNWPRASEATALALARDGVNAAVVRLAPSVYGEGPKGFMAGFVTLLVGFAREKGVSAYVIEGANRWPTVHREDAASLYRLALEKGAPGERYHGVGDPGLRMRDIATTIGERLGVPVVSRSDAEAAVHFGWFAAFAALDTPASNELTRERLGWRITRPSLFEELKRADLKKGGYSA